MEELTQAFQVEEEPEGSVAKSHPKNNDHVHCPPLPPHLSIG